jgi:hypothetical protein
METGSRSFREPDHPRRDLSVLTMSKTENVAIDDGRPACVTRKGRTSEWRAYLLSALLLGGCAAGEGERCNPLAYSDNGSQGNCQDGLACVYPTAPNCGIAYCCRVDSNGNITDENPNCQPVHDDVAACMLDLSVTPPDLSIDLRSAD